MRKRGCVFMMALMTSCLCTVGLADNRPVMKPISFLAVAQRPFSFSCLNARPNPQRSVYAFVGKNGVDLPEKQRMGDDIFQPIGGCKGPFKGNCSSYYDGYDVAFSGNSLIMTIKSVNKTRDEGMYVCKSYDVVTGVMATSKEFTPLGVFREPSVFDTYSSIHDYCLGLHCYRAFLEDIPETWIKANELCRDAGMDLPQIISEEQQHYLSALINAYPINSMWLGFRRYDDKTPWQGLSPNFSVVQPADREEEVQNCLDFVKTNNEYANDWVWKPTDCDEERNYICQHTAKPVKLDDDLMDIPICKQGSFRIGDGRCYLFVPEKVTWKEARSACSKQKGMSLLTVTDLKQDDALSRILVRTSTALGWYPEYWLDMVRDQNEVWSSNGKSLNYTHWFKNVPKLLPMEVDVCGVYTFSPNFLEIGMTGTKCGGTTVGYICKLEACGKCRYRNENSGCRQNSFSIVSIALVLLHRVM